MQKTAIKQEEYVIDLIKKQLPNDWTYINYCNEEEEEFFRQNPLDEFPDIINKFRNLQCQSHKADLFRTYYLYLYGGFVLDGDAMIYDNIENIVKDYSFVSVLSIMPNTLCNGIMGSSPKNPIIYENLIYIYNVDISKLSKSYHLFCGNLFDISKINESNVNLKLYNESNYDCGVSAKTVDDNDKIICVHYYKYKIIPRDAFNKDNIIVIGSSPIPVKIITLYKSFNNPKFNLSLHSYSDDFVFEIHHNILIVKRIDLSYGWGHNHTVEIIENI